MSALLVYYEQKDELDDIAVVLRELNGWDFHYYEYKQDSYLEIDNLISQNDIPFLVCTKDFSSHLSRNLFHFSTQHPLLTILYFSPVLKNGEFNEIYQSGIKYCFIGERRQSNLQKTLIRLSEGYWKIIPDSIYKYDYKSLPPKAKRVLRFIEKTSMKKCNTETIAGHLRISQSHFRKEFRCYFGINFREFKQRLLNHYEDILLFEKNLKPGDIYQVLDYKNLSAFSRSFKSRHGSSWQKLTRDQVKK